MKLRKKLILVAALVASTFVVAKTCDTERNVLDGRAADYLAAYNALGPSHSTTQTALNNFAGAAWAFNLCMSNN